MIAYVEMKNIMSSWLESDSWHNSSLEDQKEFQKVVDEFEMIGFEYFDFTLFEEIVREKIDIEFENCDDEFCNGIIDRFRVDIKKLMS